MITRPSRIKHSYKIPCPSIVVSSSNQAQTRAVAREDRMSRSRSLVVPGSILEDTILIYYHDPDLLFCVAEEAKPVSQFAADQGHHGDMSELG